MLNTVKGKRIGIFCVFLVLSVGVAFYFHGRSQPPPAPIKIYKATPPSPKRVTPPKSQSVRRTAVEVPTGEDPHAGHTHPHHDHAHDTETLSTETPVVDTANDTLPTPEDASVSDTEIDEMVTSIIETLEELDRRFMEKYPELLEISTMTQEDFFQAYPTAEAQQALLERVQRAQPEMFAEIRAVFSQIPRELVEDVLSEAKAHFIEHWGTEIEEQVMPQIRSEIGL